MSYQTTQRPVRERAAAAAYGTLTGLWLAGHDDVAHHLLGELSDDLIDQVVALADRDGITGLTTALQERAATSDMTVVFTPAPAPDTCSDQPVSGHTSVTVEQQVKGALVRLVPRTRLTTFTDDDAFGALVHRVTQACERDGVEPDEVLERIGHQRLTVAATMDSPAAFLAAKVRDWFAEDPDNDR